MKPLKNTRHIIEIENITAKGFGIGNIDGFTLFVDGALPGDKVDVHILKVKSRYGYGKIMEIINPSPARVKSPCPVSIHCGGCQWQHCEYQAQLDFKKRIVIDALERIGGIPNPPVNDVIGMENPARYRNKAVFPVVPSSSKDGFTIGMYAPRSHRIIEVKDCGIQHEAHINVLTAVKQHMRRHKINAYDETTHTGLMRFIMVRTSLATGEVMAVLIIKGKTLPGEREIVESLAAQGVTTTLINIHEARGNAVLGNDFRILSGLGHIHEHIGLIEYQISASSFFQINPVQTKILYETAVSQAALNDAQNAIDAHAGAGGVLLHAAKHAKSAIGIDIVPSAINDAQKNSELNGISNTQFICGAAEEVIPELLKTEVPHVMFLDPPRKGCEAPLLDAIIAAKVPRLIYISCDPATLARDIKILKTGGYNLVAAQPIDMFPFTGKVEVCCLLTI